MRRRVLVSTTGDPHCVSRFDDRRSETLSVISYDAQARSVAVSGIETGPSIDSVTTDVDTLADLGLAISSAIESFETETDGLDPAELRVGIDSLLPLLEEYGRQRLFKFLHLINGRTKHIGGVAHYQLPVERDAWIVSTLSPLFDVVIELRKRNGDAQERWLIGDGTHSSGWRSVSTT